MDARQRRGCSGALSDLVADILQGLVHHPIREVRWHSIVFVHLWGRLTRLAHDVSSLPPFEEVDTFFVCQLDVITFIGFDAPLVLLLAVREAVNVFLLVVLADEISGRGKLEGAGAPFHGNQGLHAAFAVAALADDDGPASFLQGAGHDFAGTGAEAIDQNGDGVARVRPIFGSGRLASVEGHFLLAAADRADDARARRQEQLADFDGGFEESTGVGAQVENQALDAVGLELIDDLGQIATVFSANWVMRI